MDFTGVKQNDGGGGGGGGGGGAKIHCGLGGIIGVHGVEVIGAVIGALDVVGTTSDAICALNLFSSSSRAEIFFNAI